MGRSGGGARSGCRRDLLDHMIILNERHLKDTPVGRVAAVVSPSGNKIISWQRLGGLHHRYAVAA